MQEKMKKIISAPNIEEYFELKQEIMDRINQLNNQKPVPDVVSDIPEVFVFSTSNFPNPFNPYTTINFVVARHALPVQLHIYNVRGQRIRTLLDGSTEFGAGSHDIVWNGRDDNGRNMSSGVYLYRIQAGDDVAVRRMLLMK